MVTRGRFPEFPAEHEFETVIHSNRDPKPADAPAVPGPVSSLVKLIEAGGWSVNVGYSRSWRRAQKTGVFRRAEYFGIFAWGHARSPYLITSIYWRFADKTETFAWFRDGGLEQTEKACGTAGDWTWFDGRIIHGFTRNRVKVTDIKEFAKLRGDMLPGWFAGIARRFAEQAAKALCGSLEDHEAHSWETTTGILKQCSGKATRPKEVEAI